MQGYSQEERKVSDFSKINFSISGDLYIEQADEYSLRIEGSTKDLEKVITKVDGNSLVIKTNKHSNLSGKVTVYITLPKLAEINLAGSGDVFANKAINSDNIELSIAGSGDILFKDLQTTSAELNIAGSGDIEVNGNAKENLEISIAGSGDVDALAFEAKNVEVDISGSGSSKVFATDNLDTSIVGSGSVRYKGDPLVDASSVGSGSTRAL